MLNASTKNCVLHCRACLRVKVPVVCGVFERAVLVNTRGYKRGLRDLREPCHNKGLRWLHPNDDLRGLGGSATTGTAVQKE